MPPRKARSPGNAPGASPPPSARRPRAASPVTGALPRSPQAASGLRRRPLDSEGPPGAAAGPHPPPTNAAVPRPRGPPSSPSEIAEAAATPLPAAPPGPVSSRAANGGPATAPPRPPPPRTLRIVAGVVALLACWLGAISYLDAAHSPSPHVWMRRFYGLDRGPPCYADPDIDGLEDLVEKRWWPWAGALAAELRDRAVAPPASVHGLVTHRKALAVLLAHNGTTRDVAELHDALSAAVPGCRRHCRSDIDLGSAAFAAPDGRGALQQALVAQLRRCPASVVTLRGLESLSPAALPALLPALGEGGAFVHDGRAVDATRALFFIAASVPPGALTGRSEESLARGVKSALVAGVLARARAAAAGDVEFVAAGVRAAAEALRRRIEFVAPLGLSADARALREGSLGVV